MAQVPADVVPLSKEHYEVYIVEIGMRKGKRYADRHPLNLRLDHAVGNLEKLSNLQLREAIRDLQVEEQRRDIPTAKAYDPFASQIRRSS